MENRDKTISVKDEFDLESFAEEASLAAQDLRTYGGSTIFYGKRFTYREAPRLEKAASDVRAYLGGNTAEHERMMRILSMVRSYKAPQPNSKPAKPEKTYAVNRAMRYRISIYLTHLDQVRLEMEKGKLDSASELGKEYTDAADFGDFVNSVRNLLDTCSRHDVPGSMYGFVRLCSEEGTKHEGKSA
jgi:hypothetical protein